ncbi:RDD family protein [Nonomuraea jiangxiensis]|uniref:RDD family protein n=1 Tax=Nonomuraea jiangxiensis TaxID=633440 RepID=A0A1G9TUU6_9ACTN|nr:RDD family protein [Nonomuraea jiangxiensis]SDM51509.1 RDD family protein [Nonomuraea jiangxiensis]
MSNDQQIIDDYTERVGRHLTGPSRARAKAELGEHLSDAAEAGELSHALSRLGSPEEAAATFAELRTAPPAPMDARFAAVVIDNLPLVGVTLALLVQGILRIAELGTGFGLAFPPHVYVEIGDGCVSLVPWQCDNAPYDDAGPLYSLGVPLALLWSIVGLGLLEAATGATPGKRLMKLHVVTEAGLRIHPVTGVVRRLSLLVGPFAWLDWAPVVWGDRRRVLDRLTETKVVRAR